MSLKKQTDLLRAEVVSYRKYFEALQEAYREMEKGRYGEVSERALEAIREELHAVRNIALRYDVLLGRIKREDPESSGGKQASSGLPCSSPSFSNSSEEELSTTPFDLPGSRGPDLLSLLVEMDPLATAEEEDRCYQERAERFCEKLLWRNLTGEVTPAFIGVAVDRMFTPAEVIDDVRYETLQNLKYRICQLYFPCANDYQSRVKAVLSPLPPKKNGT